MSFSTEDITRQWASLPASQIAVGVNEALHTNSSLVVTAPPGAGKSTLLPLTILSSLGEGEKIPRKGGPGITKSDLLVINKIDIAPYVHSDLGVMERDTKTQRGDKPFVFTNLFDGTGLDEVIRWIKEDVLFEDQPLQE